MAKVRNNVIVRGLSGKLGDQLVLRHLRDGQTVVCAKPDFSRRVLSRGQKSHHERFKAAAAYAREAAVSQPIYAKLAQGTIKNAYNLALGDWFHPPVIDGIERQKGKIIIHASDDVCVRRVHVTITDAVGKILEQGEAVQVKGEVWEYKTKADGKIIVEVRDLPGNVTKREL